MDDFQNCIWIVEEIKKGNIREEDLDEVRKYLGKYFKRGLPLPNFYPNFPVMSNYQLVKDTVDKNVDLLFTGHEGQKEKSIKEKSWIIFLKLEINLFRKRN
jgi:hypothetical protein